MVVECTTIIMVAMADMVDLVVVAGEFFGFWPLHFLWLFFLK
jgi:hypothetical protein